MHVAAIVLAAGASSRFGGQKLLATVGGRPVLRCVLDAIAGAGIDDVTVVLGADAELIEGAIEWGSARRVRNPEPSRGLASSLREGMTAVLREGVRTGATADAILIVLGDQPLLSPETIELLRSAATDPARPIVVPHFVGDAARNPVLLLPPAYAITWDATGDRGLGPVIDVHPRLVTEVPMPGSNPDVDRPGDLVAVLEAAWADRVRANAEQVERHREIPDGTDFYAPVSQIFTADPERTDEPALDLLRAEILPGETWLDIGAGAGRYALPISRIAGQVIAVDPSPKMLERLRDQAAQYGATNIRTFRARWPLDPGDPDGAAAAAALGRFPCADVALIAHVSYDIAAIGPFVDALEASARRMCAALLMERQPSSIADVCWPPVHGEERVSLPALPEFVELLRARGRTPEITIVPREQRRFASRDELAFFLRRQLWIAEGGPREAIFQAALDPLVEAFPDGGVGLRDQRPLAVGFVTWAP